VTKPPSSNRLGVAFDASVKHAEGEQAEPETAIWNEMETAVRWSHRSVEGNECFLFVEVVGKAFKLCRVKSRRKGVLRYEIISEHRKVPSFRAFDWSPSHEGIVAVGQSSGEATVLRIDDGSQAVLSFPIRNQRLCNAVAFNNQNLLAAGLDKVRTDNCLNIWDLQQQMPSGNTSGFFTSTGRTHPEPLHKLASSEPITSIKFFHDEPQTLVAGVKGQFVRLYDLREAPGSASIQFATRCVNNIAIDSMDENCFASCYPTNGATICIWDRRMGSRPPVTQTGFFSASSGESTSLRSSLELRNVAETPGSIWSLRFSNTRRGCLGMLSSTGHFKTYDIGKEYQKRDLSSIVDDDPGGKVQGMADPEELYLKGIQDLQHAYCHSKEGRPEAERVVSFDFMNLGGTWNEPKAITLNGNGLVAELSIPMVPEPEIFSSIGLIHRGRKQIQQPSNLVTVVLGNDSNKVPTTKVKPAETKLQGAVETLIQYMRCINGYLFSFKKNQAITSELLQLKDFWLFVERAHKEQLAGNTIQDNLDLSYLGVHAIWMDDLGPKPHKTRNLGPSSIKMAKVTENLVLRLKIPSSKMCSTDYEYHRRLCLYLLQQAWTYEELEKMVNELVSQNHHTKAAAIAFFASESRLAYRALRSSPLQFDKMLAMAIVSAIKRTTGDEDENDDEWAETIEALARDLTDPFAHAILAFVKEGDWNAVIEEETLPLSYRIGVAVRWLNDSALCQYVSRITKDVIVAGNIEGIILTGLGTTGAFDLLHKYLQISGDLQTAVLALTLTVPRYIDGACLKRKFMMWRETYREYINSWNLHFSRVDFDITSSRIAVDANGKRLLEASRPQIALTCGYCNQSIAQLDQEDEDTVNASATHRTQRHPLSSEKVAAIGTICPKCGRRLPRCGVCDMELGMPDPSYLKWYARGQKLGSVDLSASLAASVVTTLGPGTTRTMAGSDPPGTSRSKTGSDPLDTNRSKSGSDPPKTNKSKSGSDPAETNRSKSGSDPPGKITQDLIQSKPVDEDKFRKFIAFCIKCSHGFHANHAIDWFRGVNGRQGHLVCPVSECSCVCNV
jgi:WD repeat-containing protein mio